MHTKRLPRQRPLPRVLRAQALRRPETLVRANAPRCCVDTAHASLHKLRLICGCLPPRRIGQIPKHSPCAKHLKSWSTQGPCLSSFCCLKKQAEVLRAQVLRSLPKLQ